MFSKAGHCCFLSVFPNQRTPLFQSIYLFIVSTIATASNQANVTVKARKNCKNPIEIRKSDFSNMRYGTVKQPVVLVKQFLLLTDAA